MGGICPPCSNIKIEKEYCWGLVRPLNSSLSILSTCPWLESSIDIHLVR